MSKHDGYVTWLFSISIWKYNTLAKGNLKTQVGPGAGLDRLSAWSDRVPAGQQGGWDSRSGMRTRALGAHRSLLERPSWLEVIPADVFWNSISSRKFFLATIPNQEPWGADLGVCTVNTQWESLGQVPSQGGLWTSLVRTMYIWATTYRLGLHKTKRSELF